MFSYINNITVIRKKSEDKTKQNNILGILGANQATDLQACSMPLLQVFLSSSMELA